MDVSFSCKTTWKQEETRSTAQSYAFVDHPSAARGGVSGV